MPVTAADVARATAMAAATQIAAKGSDVVCELVEAALQAEAEAIALAQEAILIANEVKYDINLAISFALNPDAAVAYAEQQAALAAQQALNTLYNAAMASTAKLCPALSGGSG